MKPHVLKNKYLHKRDLINKNIYKSIGHVPVFTKSTLHFGCRDGELKTVAKHLLALELMTGAKPKLSKSTKNNAVSKLKKGSLTGAYIVIKKGLMSRFLKRFVEEISPKLKQSSVNINSELASSFTLSVKKPELSAFEELGFNKTIFSNLSTLTLSISISKQVSPNDRRFLLSVVKS